MIQIVFEDVTTEASSAPELRFVEVEDERGHSISVGTWRDAESRPKHRILSIDIEALARVGSKVKAVRELRNRLFANGDDDAAEAIAALERMLMWKER